MARLDGSERVFGVPGWWARLVLGRASAASAGFTPLHRLPGGLASLRLALAAGRFRTRTDGLERDPSFLQLIPYVVPVHRGRVFVYRRPAAGGDARLGGRLSCGVGGHWNPPDSATCWPWSRLEGAYQCAARELVEELAAPSGPILPAGLVRDGDDVGRVHLGLVLAWSVPELGAGLDGSPDVEPLGLVPPENLAAFLARLEDARIGRAEAWTRHLAGDADFLVRTAVAAAALARDEMLAATRVTPRAAG